MAPLKKLEEKFLAQDLTDFVKNLSKPSLKVETKNIESKSRAESERYSVYNTIFAFLFNFSFPDRIGMTRQKAQLHHFRTFAPRMTSKLLIGLTGKRNIIAYDLSFSDSGVVRQAGI